MKIDFSMPILFICSLIWSVLGANISHSAPPSPCAVSSSQDGQTIYTFPSDVGVSNECTVTPTKYSVKVYQFGLCSVFPTYENYGKSELGCKKIGDYPDGREFDFVNLSDSSKDVEIDWSEHIGEYTHFYIVAGIAPKIQVKITYAEDKKGRTGIGKKCWTLDSSVSENNGRFNSRSDLKFDCGDEFPQEIGTSHSHFRWGGFAVYPSVVRLDVEDPNIYTLGRSEVSFLSGPNTLQTDMSHNFGPDDPILIAAPVVGSSLKVDGDSDVRVEFLMNNGANINHKGSRNWSSMCGQTVCPAAVKPFLYGIRVYNN